MTSAARQRHCGRGTAGERYACSSTTSSAGRSSWSASPRVRLSTPEVLDDDACTRAIVGAARAIGVRAGPTDSARLPGLDAWLTDLDEHELRFPEDDPIGADLIGIARKTLLRLLETTTESVVLHGDLHHDNVLRHGDGWVVIDPHGYVGDPAAEPATMLYNPIPYVFERADVDVPSLVERRLHLWSEESDLDPERVRQWALVKAVSLRSGRRRTSVQPQSTCWLPGCWPPRHKGAGHAGARRVAAVTRGPATTVPNRCSSREERSCVCSGLTLA